MPSLRRPVGVIYGDVSSTGFDLAVADPALRRLDYVELDQDGQRILCQVGEVERQTNLSFEQALAQDGATEDRLSAHVDVVGYIDARGLVQTPRNPFRAGTTVFAAGEDLVLAVLGLETEGEAGAYIGHVKGSRTKVKLSLNVLAQKHVSILAKTGAGKSYTVGVLLEEFLKAKVPLVILDPHGEYGSLRNPNIEESEIDVMVRFGIKPKTFQKQIREFALDTFLNPDADKLRLEGLNLEGHEVADLLGGKLSGGQMGVLYQAVKELKESNPGYSLRDIIDRVSENKSSAKWNVINALEALDSTNVFAAKGTPVKELVQASRCTILNLKGVAPEIQDIAVTRITNLLWEARKRNEIPPHILVVEEAHNFCPERGVGNAVAGPVLRTVASEGRKFGMGLVIVSQRPAKIDKNVLSQCNTQFVLKVTNPNDLKAIVASVEGITSASADELQRLPVGVALVAGGGLTQPVFVDVRPRHTRHGGRSVEVVQSGARDRSDPEPEEEEVAMPADAHPAFTKPVEPKRRNPAPAKEPEAVPSLAKNAPTPPVGPPGATHPSASPAPAAGPSARVLPGRQAPVRAPAARPDASGDDSGMLGKTAHPVKTTWSQKDKAQVQRVASRVGYVRDEADAERTFAILRRLAEQNHQDPDERLTLYHGIAEEVCFAEAPACVRCPLNASCQYHAHLQAQRKKTRNPIRRLWRR
jgi:uncharacterized protein